MGTSAAGGLWAEHNYNVLDNVDRHLTLPSVQVNDTVAASDVEPSCRIGFVTDGHFADGGRYDRNSRERHEALLGALDAENLDLLVLGGDNICHPNDGARDVAQELLEEYFGTLGVPVYGAHGNHDRMTDADWAAAYGHLKNHYVRRGNVGIVLLDTATPAGGEREPDRAFLERALGALAGMDHVFVVSHFWFNGTYDAMMTGPGDSSLVDDAATRLIHDSDNVRAVLHGHNHGPHTGIVYRIERAGVRKPYLAGRHVGGTNDSVAGGYWLIDVDGTAAAATFKTLGNRGAQTAGYL